MVTRLWCIELPGSVQLCTGLTEGMRKIKSFGKILYGKQLNEKIKSFRLKTSVSLQSIYQLYI